MRNISLVIFLLVSMAAFAQPPLGSRSMIHTQSARTFDSGRLEVHSNMNFFTRATEFIGSGQAPSNFHAVNYWLVAGNLAITYGILDNLDFTIAPRVYQDTHYKNEYNLPGDIFMSLKLGSFAFMRRHLYGGVMANVRLGTGEVHNYPFTEYASGATEYGFTGALSYFLDPYLPDRSFNAHLNLGWWNHNEAGKPVFKFESPFGTHQVGDELIATKNSTEFQYAFGLVYPTAMFNYNLEFYGISYITEPDEFVYSRENYMYLTPSIRYKAFSWVSMDLGIDIRLSKDENTTKGVPDKTPEKYDLPNYAAWRVHMGLNITLLPFTATKKTPAQVEREQFNKRVEFFQKIVQEREKAEDVQQELDRLKEERQEAEKELEELKQILEEQNQ